MLLICPLAKDAARPQRQHQKDGEETDRRAVGRIENQEGQFLGDADGQGADNGTGNAAEPTDDSRGKDRENAAEAGQRTVRVEARNRKTATIASTATAKFSTCWGPIRISKMRQSR